MATIKEDIETFSQMIIGGFKTDNIKLDYSLSSFKKIDSFFDEHSKNGEAIPEGRLSKNLGQILFALGAYVGKTLIKLIPDAKWEIDENGPEKEVGIVILFPDGGKIWPVKRMIKRFQNGEEDGIYVYGYHMVSKYSDIDKILKKEKKSFWKFLK